VRLHVKPRPTMDLRRQTQRETIARLLLMGWTAERVARRMGVTARAIRYHISTPEFEALYAKLQREHLGRVGRQLGSLLNGAVDALERLLKNTDWRARDAPIQPPRPRCPAQGGGAQGLRRGGGVVRGSAGTARSSIYWTSSTSLMPKGSTCTSINRPWIPAPQAAARCRDAGVFAKFERSMIVERVHAGLRKARVKGTKSGRPFGRPRSVPRSWARFGSNSPRSRHSPGGQARVESRNREACRQRHGTAGAGGDPEKGSGR